MVPVILETVDGTFRMLAEDELDSSILAGIGNAIARYLHLLAGALGKQQLHQSQDLLQRKTSLVLWVYFTEHQEMFMQHFSLYSGITGYSFLCIQPCFAHHAWRMELSSVGNEQRKMDLGLVIGYQCVFA